LAIQRDAGKVAAAVPRNIVAIGSVPDVGEVAIYIPANPPTVITMTETVWKSACAQEQDLAVHRVLEHGLSLPVIIQSER
jgi:hypothetical protein